MKKFLTLLVVTAALGWTGMGMAQDKPAEPAAATAAAADAAKPAAPAEAPAAAATPAEAEAPAAAPASK